MPPRCRALLAACLATALLAGGEAEPPLRLRVADGPELQRAWASSLLGRTWARPELSPLREAWQAWYEGCAAAWGWDPLAVLAAGTGIELHLTGAARDRWGGWEPRLRLRAELGSAWQRLRPRCDAEDAPAPPPPLGADEAWSLGSAVCARYGTAMVYAQHEEPLPMPPGSLHGDWTLVGDLARLAAALPEPAAGVLARMGAARLELHGRLTADGIEEELLIAAPPAGWRPVDRALLARLPPQTLAVLAIGLDGSDEGGRERLAVLAALLRSGLLAAADPTGRPLLDDGAELAALQLPLDGTSLALLTPGSGAPGLTLALPRSAALDRALEDALARLGGRTPADDGRPVGLPLPRAGLPLVLQVLRDPTHWVVSSDPAVVAAWGRGALGGAPPALRAALAAAPAEACVVGASDTPALLRWLAGLVAALAALPGQSDAAAAWPLALATLAEHAHPGWLHAVATSEGWRLRSQGLVGAGSLLALMGALGVERLLDQAEAETALDAWPDAADGEGEDPELAAMVMLGGIIATAERSFQDAALLDQDGDGVGEYATLPELLGEAAVPGAQAPALLPPGLPQAPVFRRYRYAIFLPTADGRAAAERGAADPRAADAQERRFVAYAWPAEVGAGTRMFAIDQRGLLHAAPFDGTPPAWDALYGGQGWEAEPRWPAIDPPEP